MGLTRRHFLQRAGVALAAWGVSEVGLWSLRDRYQQVLAAPTSRKLALLIGINQYPFSSSLEGCGTDVELQRELLVHRFGFHPSDVLVLTDGQATRDAIETAFTEHLIQPAQAGDVVVVHFSGFGSTLAGDEANSARNSLVMADAMPSGDTPIVNDLLLETLGLLLRSLKTDKVTTVLDTSYVYPGQPLQGNLRIRSYPNPSMAQPSEAELALQERLLSQLRISRDRLAPAFPDQLPGLVLAATALDQVATEVRWNRFSAGLFTSALTQSLWQATPATTIYTSIRQAIQQVELFAGQQQPQLTGQRAPNKQDTKLAPYFLAPATPGMDGAIVALDDGNNQAQLWLGGLSASLLEQYGVNSLFTVLEASSQNAASPPLLQITAREGFLARSKVLAGAEAVVINPDLQIGQQVREAVRVLPRNVGLTVALDGSLERIERVDAISALTAVPHVSSAIAGEQSADYLFSKIQSAPTQLATSSTNVLSGIAATPSSISYGLFSPGRDVILSTTGEGGEAVKVAVRRLVPKLQTLLATKLLHLTVNQQTSQLAIAAQLEQVAPKEQVLVQQATNRTAPAFPNPTKVAATQLPPAQLADAIKLPVGSRIRYRVKNLGTDPVYSLAIALDSASNLLWLQLPTPEQDETLPGNTEAVSPAIAPNGSVLLPSAASGTDWQVQGVAGLAETFLILSRVPFNQTLTLLANQQKQGNSAIVGAAVTNPVDVAQSILQDLHQTTALTATLNLPDAYSLDVNTWATFRFTYQIV
ncbi:MAG: caspase family protein [Leptolyngbyaceae cyanobacterium bins.302]|nr:caspase family protein [Leptolyngbyaceae cyanobacterium bins.302]